MRILAYIVLLTLVLGCGCSQRNGDEETIKLLNDRVAKLEAENLQLETKVQKIEEHRLAHHSNPEEPAQWVKDYLLTVEQIEDPAILAQLHAIRELMSEYVEKQNELLRKKHENFERNGDRPEKQF